MAKDTTTATPTTPATPTAPAAAPTQPKAEKPKDQVGRYQEKFPTAEDAVKEATSRVKGPNRAFTATIGDKTVHVVAGNWDRAAGIAFMDAGGKVEEIGKPERTRTAKPVGVDGIMAAVNALPEAERAAVLAQLKSIAQKPAEPAKK